MKPASCYLAITSIFLLPVTAGAENLQQAWSDAVASHNQLAAAAARREAAGFNLESAQAERWPRLDVSSAFTQLDEAPRFDFGGGSTSQQIFDNDNFAQAGVRVSLPLYAGGAISAGVEAAEYAAEASSEQYEAVLQDIKLGTGEHYIRVLRAESGLEVAESNVKTLKAHTERARQQYEFGSVAKNDVLAASVALAHAEQRRLQAENALDFARAAYNRYLNRPLEQPVSLDPELDIDGLVPAGESLASLILVATEERDELAAMQAEANALRENSTAVRARSRPQFALTGGYMYLENAFLDSEEVWMAGLSFQWNLFNAGRNRDRAAALDRQALAVSHTRSDLMSSISLQVRRAWNDRQEAEARTRVAEVAVDQAIENLRVVQNRYEAGSSTNIEVLDAETLRQQALSNRDNARYDLAMAKLRLARAIGAL
ncbi:MAG TPA: TolC family protein [Woeseiaceae bacterium]|nr:TolC family protein [Woeseiaceae bacterium]